jgi:hypothetical protein
MLPFKLVLVLVCGVISFVARSSFGGGHSSSARGSCTRTSRSLIKSFFLVKERKRNKNTNLIETQMRAPFLVCHRVWVFRRRRAVVPSLPLSMSESMSNGEKAKRNGRAGQVIIINTLKIAVSGVIADKSSVTTVRVRP